MAADDKVVIGRADEARSEFRAALAESNEADDGTCRLPAPYLLAVSQHWRQVPPST